MKHLLLCTSAIILTLSACQPSHKTDNPDEACDSTAIVSPDSHLSDSTLYGISDDFGMSTFTLITTKGDTLYLTRTDSKGKDGKIYGSLREDDHYAVTTCDDNKAIDVLINVSQLNKHLKDYQISNGHLIINEDTVEIETLSDSVFEYK